LDAPTGLQENQEASKSENKETKFLKMSNQKGRNTTYKFYDQTEIPCMHLYLMEMILKHDE